MFQLYQINHLCVMRKSRTLLLSILPFLVIAIVYFAGVKSAATAQPVNQPLNNNVTMKTLHDFQVTDINGNSFDLSGLKGKKVLVVNTASECGLTPQYAQLQELYDAHGGERFEIIGFPSNDFGRQEPGSDSEIASFCSKNYGVSFPMMSKISVKGGEMAPVYQWLTSKALNGVGDFEVKWNFHKFLVDEDGKLVRDVAPQVAPIDDTILSWLTE